MYTNIKTGQTSSERPECDPYFVETDLFLKFTPEESEALSEVGTCIGGAPRPELLAPCCYFVVVIPHARLATETSCFCIIPRRGCGHPQPRQSALYGAQKNQQPQYNLLNE